MLITIIYFNKKNFLLRHFFKFYLLVNIVFFCKYIFVILIIIIFFNKSNYVIAINLKLILRTFKSFF